MYERIFRALVLLCLLSNAISISGSTRIHRSEQQARDRRDASCPSCRRERPDALVSWYSQPSRREYQPLQPETNHWPTNQQYQSISTFHSSPYNSYDRASGSRGALSNSNIGGTCKRENPFAVQRDVDFDMAAAQTAPVRPLEDPVTPYQPRFTAPRGLDRTPYRKPNFYDLIKRQSDLLPVNGYSDYGSSNDEATFDGRLGSSGPFRPHEDSNRRVYTPYGDDRYADESFEEENPIVKPQQYHGRQVLDRREPEVNWFLEPRREPQEPRIFAPKAQQNSYNLPAEINVYRIMQDLGAGGAEVVNESRLRKEEGRSLSKLEEQGDQQIKDDRRDNFETTEARSEGDEPQETKQKRDNVGEDDDGGKSDNSDVSRDKSAVEFSTEGASSSVQPITMTETAA